MRFLVVILWVAWGVSWLAASPRTARTEKRAASQLGYRALMTLGGIVLAIPAHRSEGRLRLWHVGLPGAWTCVVLIAVGMGFAWWARLHLDRLWSGEVTRKAEHHVVESGPYAIVRHPIYTGMLLAVLATAAVKGTIPGVAGAALVVAGTWMKARLEERWVSQELEANAYQSYRSRVPMLIPFGPRGDGSGPR